MAVLTRAIEVATARQQWTHVAELWHDAARLELLDLVGGIDTWARPKARLAQARFDLVHARTAGSVAGLEAVGKEFEQMGALLYSAEAIGAATALARKQGAAKDAIRLDGLTGTLISRFGGANTPLLVGRSSSGPLSTREAEIAQLASSGLSNRQIAEQLIVSERTVENHLYRIFIKLGVGARDELAAALATR